MFTVSKPPCVCDVANPIRVIGKRWVLVTEFRRRLLQFLQERFWSLKIGYHHFNYANIFFLFSIGILGAIKVSHNRSIYPEISCVVSPSIGIQGPLNSQLWRSGQEGEKGENEGK
jgi:hypothetical protein